MRKLALALLVGAFVLTPHVAHSLVMCGPKKPDGTLRDGASIRLRTACRPNELQLDPVALGLQGPEGAAGPQGNPGPSHGCVLRQSCQGTGLTDRGLVGVIMLESDYANCDIVGSPGGVQQPTWIWCHPRLCCAE